MSNNVEGTDTDLIQKNQAKKEEEYKGLETVVGLALKNLAGKNTTKERRDNFAGLSTAQGGRELPDGQEESDLMVNNALVDSEVVPNEEKPRVQAELLQQLRRMSMGYQDFFIGYEEQTLPEREAFVVNRRMQIDDFYNF